MEVLVFLVMVYLGIMAVQLLLGALYAIFILSVDAAYEIMHGNFKDDKRYTDAERE